MVDTKAIGLGETEPRRNWCKSLVGVSLGSILLLVIGVVG